MGTCASKHAAGEDAPAPPFEKYKEDATANSAVAQQTTNTASFSERSGLFHTRINSIDEEACKMQRSNWIERRPSTPLDEGLVSLLVARRPLASSTDKLLCTTRVARVRPVLSEHTS
jgi:hypothetical protein